MKSVIVIVLALVVSVVNSQTFPHVSFMGKTLANHSYVNIRNDFSGSDSVQCITDLTTCCKGTDGPHRGDWYFPDGTRLPFSGDGDIYEQRESQRVHLRRRNSAKFSPVGIYHCSIPTNVVHDGDIAVRETVHVGLYSTGGGNYK